MKTLFLYFFATLSLFAASITAPLTSVKGHTATIHIDKIDVGMSGFIVHKLSGNRSIILNDATVVSFDKAKKEATLKLTPFTLFKNNNLPTLKISAKAGDIAVLAFAYNRGLLIAPTEDIYYTLKNAMHDEVFVHPDVFATHLSYKGHPTPLQEDFTTFCDNVSLGLVFFYLEQNLYTLDCHTFKILNIQKAPLQQHGQKLPFYTRVDKIDANWFGAGSDELEDYEPYYYELLYKNNPNNETLKKNIAASNEANVTKLAKELGLEKK